MRKTRAKAALRWGQFEKSRMDSVTKVANFWEFSKVGEFSFEVIGMYANKLSFCGGGGQKKNLYKIKGWLQNFIRSEEIIVFYNPD